MKAFFIFSFLVVFLAAAALPAGPSHPAPPVPDLAPAPAPQDSLPQGRHEITSYRNGLRTEVVVDKGKIQKLVIDGEEIAAGEYDRYRGRVERMLGTDEMFVHIDLGNLDRLIELQDGGFPELKEEMELLDRRLQRVNDQLEAQFREVHILVDSVGINNRIKVRNQLQKLETVIETLGDRGLFGLAEPPPVPPMPPMPPTAPFADAEPRHFWPKIQEVVDQLAAEGYLPANDKGFRSLDLKKRTLKIDGYEISKEGRDRFEELLDEADIVIGNNLEINMDN